MENVHGVSHVPVFFSLVRLVMLVCAKSEHLLLSTAFQFMMNLKYFNFVYLEHDNVTCVINKSSIYKMQQKASIVPR